MKRPASLLLIVIVGLLCGTSCGGGGGAPKPIGQGVSFSTPHQERSHAAIVVKPFVGETFTASVGRWSNRPTRYAYQWRDCDSKGAHCVRAAGSPSQGTTYTVVAGDLGHTLDVTVTATNARGSTTAKSPATGLVGGSAPVNAGRPVPVNLGPPVITGNDVQGATLSTTTGVWSRTPSGLAYQWQDCDSSGASCATIPGATSRTYTLGPDDVDHTIRAVVTASGAERGSATSASTAVVTSSPSTVCASSCLTTETPIASAGLDGNTTDGGNGWGWMKLRAARSSDGTLFAVYTTGPSINNDRPYTLVKSTNNGASWTTVESGNDGGREQPLLLVDPGTNTVYLIIEPWTCPPGANYCSPSGSRYGYPVLVNEGVDGNGPRATTAIPGSWEYGLGTMSCGCAYASAAIDTSGNIYFLEGLTANAMTDAGYRGNLAWTSGGTGKWTWHFTNLPGVGGTGSAQDVRYDYTYLLPDNHGGLDAVGVSAVSCTNSAWISANNYVLAGNESTSYGCFIVDRVENWHTSNLNATDGPAWTLTQVGVNSSNENCSTCIEDSVNVFMYLDDAYRDTSGKVHILWSSSTSSGGMQSILVNGSVSTTAALPNGNCVAGHARMTQDYSGRFWLVSSCDGNAIYRWYATDTNGLRFVPAPTITTTNTLDGDPYDYLAPPRAGTVQGQKYLDLLIPHNSYKGLLYFRLKLDQ